jgi:peptidoglycan hydrolase CwlO-like protein
LEATPNARFVCVLVRSANYVKQNVVRRLVASQRSSYTLVPAVKSLNEAHQMLTTNGALLNASSELNQLREENERLKEENGRLKQQIEQLEESTRKPNDRIDTLEKIIEERDEDIDTLKKEIDLSAEFGAICSFNVSNIKTSVAT